MQDETLPENDKNQESQQTPVSACGCDTDHHNGVYISTEYQGKRIYFCAQDCKDEFLEDPVAFLNSDHFVLDFSILDNI